MARREVTVSRTLDLPANAVWLVVRDFCGQWHPLVETIVVERLATGGLVRRFTVKGEASLYREQLTYFSDSDQTLSYRHLDGILGIDAYTATLRVFADGERSCVVEWKALINAEDKRADQVAEGTRAVFELGVDALRDATPNIRHDTRHTLLAELENINLPGMPALALTACGPGSETLCLFLHGIGGNRSNWEQQLPVAGNWMKAAALDLRGYGGSTLGPAPSTVDDYCDDILRVMRHFGAQQIILCGLSYGSWIATSFAMRHPDLLKGLVLSGGCTGMSEASVEERENFRKAREVPLNAGKTPKDFAPAVVEVIASAHATPELRRVLVNSMACIPAQTYRDALQCFTNPKERFDFAKLTMPVMFVTGEHDRLASPSEIHGVSLRVHAQSAMPNLRFEVLADAGHVCNIEKPQDYNALLQEFLQSVMS